ncbi:actin related protein [Nitzschia inconspicua]|uniref:Actin related protein n=1 Tax=Nitzschia inconspicua TaxID=303405 RepID=A0A9K3M589_9STRA|nr:actin related protein [Nitzschia inconspicua]
MTSEETAAEGDAGSSLLLNQPVVIDNGTSTLKAGFAGSSKPKVVIGTKVGRAKHMRIMPGGALETEQSLTGPSSMFVGKKLDEHRGSFILEYPMDKGHVVDGGWDAMESLWEHLYSKPNINVKAEDHPVLMTEAPLNPRQNRDKVAEIFFESFRAPALFFAPPAVLSLYASGRTTGVVLDVGEGVTHAVPVYEGFALPYSVTRSDVAGRDVTRQMQLLLRRSGLTFTTTAEADLVKTMKEETCFLTRTPAADDSTEKDSKTQYTLPDGQSVTLSTERYQAPNILFDPSLIGSEEAGVADILVDSIMKSDIDLRSTLFSQVVLAGGSTLFPGFGDRMLYEVRSRSPSHTKIRISAPPERVNSTFVGGSILASLATFKSMWTSKQDYEEHGSNILHRDKL